MYCNACRQYQDVETKPCRRNNIVVKEQFWSVSNFSFYEWQLFKPYIIFYIEKTASSFTLIDNIYRCIIGNLICDSHPLRIQR